MRPSLIALIVLFTGLLVWGLWPSHAPTDEELIAALIDDGADAASVRDLGRLLAHVSPDFEGDFGGRAQLEEGLSTLLMAMRGAEIRALPKTTHVEGTRATSDFTIVVVRPHSPDAKPLSSQRLHLALERQGGQWLVTEARGIDQGSGL